MARKRWRLAQRRKAAGHSQEQLAELLGVDRSTVVRWERGESDPQPWVRPRLADALHVKLEELNVLLADTAELRTEGGIIPSSTVPLDFSLPAGHTVMVMERFSAHDVASRRQVLATMTVLTGAGLLQPVRQWAAACTPMVPAASSGIDLEQVAELERAVPMFRRWDASGVGGLRRKAIVGQLNAVAETLRDSHPPAVTQRLFQITAELAQLCGWMAYDQGLHGMAQRYYLLALHACREAAAADLGAKIIGDMTQLSTALGNYEDSLNLVRTALYSLPRKSSDLVRSELLGLEARAYAQLGEREASHAARSAEACVAVWQEAPSDPPPDWMHYMNDAEVDCLAANAYIELALHNPDHPRRQRFADHAERYTLHACDSRVKGYTRSRILDEIRLAKVRLAQDEPAESAQVGRNALRMSQSARSAVVVDWLVRFDRQLTDRYAGQPDVADFHDQLRDYLRQAAPGKETQLSGTQRG